jgi:hypothetical protein
LSAAPSGGAGRVDVHGAGQLDRRSASSHRSHLDRAYRGQCAIQFAAQSGLSPRHNSVPEPGGPVRRDVLASDRPTCSVTPSRAGVGLFGAMCSRQTGPPSRRVRMTSQRDEQPIPLTPLGADRPRWHCGHA